MKQPIVLFLLLVSAIQTEAQHLSRHAFLGIQMDPVTDDVARAMKLPDTAGVLISRVIPGSTAEAAGLQKSDILLKLSDSSIYSIAQAMRIVKSFSEGQKFSYTIRRAGQKMSSTFVIKGLPYEKYDGADIIYGEIKSGSALLRTIINRPKRSGRLPAVLFIQGIGCYSMDSPLDTDRPEIKLFRHLTRSGFVVMRVDKSGMGDSRGTPCDRLDFDTELDGYKQAYEAMKKLDYVDTANCFIIGHSMGGVMAPLVAKSEAVKGIIAYGTIGVNFMEYWIDTRRTIADAYEMNPADKDDYMKEECQCAGLLLNAHMTEEEALKINPACKASIDVLLLRDYPYWNQLMNVNIPGLWQNYSGNLLALWGSADYISARSEHQLITDIVNKEHRGHATFREIHNAAHTMKTAASFADARVNTGGEFNSSIADIMSDWLKQQIN